MQNLPIKIGTQRLFIQTPAVPFIEKIVDYLLVNREFFQPWLPQVSNDFFSAKGQRDILEEDLILMRQDRQVRFYLFKKEEEKIIGDFTFSNITRGVMQSCFLGYKLAEKENGKGYMREALQAGIDFAFQELKVHRIEASIIPRNNRSLALIANLGFHNEGISKQYLKINGKWEDHSRFARLNDSDL